MAKIEDLNLTQDEIDHLASDNQKRCNACGHLEILHNQHCCFFCTVGDCECEWGEMPEDE